MTSFCKVEIFFGLDWILTKNQIPNTKIQFELELELEPMSVNANVLLNQAGIYTDLIRMINDYTVGDRVFWKGKYDSVIHELKTLFTLTDRNWYDMESLIRNLNEKRQIDSWRKIHCVMQYYTTSLNDSDKTASIYDLFNKHGVIGLYRVAFDNIVFKMKQRARVKQYDDYSCSVLFFKVTPKLFFKATPKLLRHIHDYNHTEYECYYNFNRITSIPIWVSKFNWGSRYVQTNIRAVCNQITTISETKRKWIVVKNRQTNNNFKAKYKLASNIKISHVNDKSVRVSVNTFDGKHMEVTKKIGEDKKTKRLYICHPVLKKRRLYADEKFIHCPPKYFTLYKNM